MTVAESLQQVQQKIRQAVKERHAAAGEPCLIAVSKQQPVEKILEAIAAGQLDFGENYVQAAEAVWPVLKPQHPKLKLHMIGHAQSNKAKEIVALFDVLHSLASRSLASKLAALQAEGRPLPELLVQVNTGDEPQKSGILPAELPEFIRYCREDCGLRIAGLMCIPPEEEDPRLHFALLKQWAERLGLAKLSMGMSGDYEAAVRMGADYVRVGTAIFGARAV